MKPENYKLKLGNQFIVILEISNSERLETISNILKNHGASTLLNNVFSFKAKADDTVREVADLVKKIDLDMLVGETLLIIHNDGKGLSGDYVLVKEDEPGKGIRVGPRKPRGQNHGVKS